MRLSPAIRTHADLVLSQVRFYERLYEHPYLVAHCPLYFGTLELREQRRTGCNSLLQLEDLTAQFQRPCVCDVKIGTVQHGHDASRAKAIRSLEKCRQTTSSKLGFRLCGMQVWQPKAHAYLHRDKYQGRRVRVDEIDAAVAGFFDDGNVLRRDAIRMLEGKLKDLLATMQEHTSHRFFSASVLMIYEGDAAAPARCDVRLIDFAHTANVAEVPHMQGQTHGPDNGLLLGLVRLLDVLQRLSDTRCALELAALPASGDACMARGHRNQRSASVSPITSPREPANVQHRGNPTE